MCDGNSSAAARYVCDLYTYVCGITSATNHGSSFNLARLRSILECRHIKRSSGAQANGCKGGARMCALFVWLCKCERCPPFDSADQSNAIYHFQDYSRYMTVNDFGRFSSLIFHFRPSLASSVASPTRALPPPRTNRTGAVCARDISPKKLQFRALEVRWKFACSFRSAHFQSLASHSAVCVCALERK